MQLKSNNNFRVRLAQSDDDLRAAQRLRYEVFVAELGGSGALVDHEARLERDAFDPFFDHLLLEDGNLPDAPVVGVYRMLRGDQALEMGRFYSESEYDLTTLKASGRRLLELGRSCLAPSYRGGTAMYHLWNGLAAYVRQHEIEVLFGVASFHGNEPAQFAQALSYLHHNHLAPPQMRVVAHGEGACRMDVLPPEQIDRRDAMLTTPSLIKAYLRLGGFVGEGAFIDREFNTIDVCLLMDTARLSPRHARLYTQNA